MARAERRKGQKRHLLNPVTVFHLVFSMAMGYAEPRDRTSLFVPNTQWIGLRENLQESPIFNGKNHGFL